MACTYYRISIANDNRNKIRNIIETNFSNRNDKIVLASEFNNHNIAKWAVKQGYIKEQGDLLSANTNSIKGWFDEYIKTVTPEVKKSIVDRYVERLDGWSSSKAKKDAVFYTSHLINTEYYKNVINFAKNPANRLTPNQILGNVRTIILQEFLSKANSWFAVMDKNNTFKNNAQKYKNDKGEEVKTTTYGKFSYLFDRYNEIKNKPSSLREYRKNILDERTKIYNEWTKAKKENNAEEVAKLEQRLKDIVIELKDNNLEYTATQEAVKIARQNLFEYTLNIIKENKGKDGNIRILNFSILADNVFSAENASSWFNSVLALPDMFEISKSFEHTKLETRDAFRENVQDEDDSNSSGDNEEDNERDYSASHWNDPALKDYAKYYASKLKLYLATLPQRSASIINEDSNSTPMYLHSDELGTVIYMDKTYVTNELQSLGVVRDVKHFIDVIAEKANTIPSLYGLGQLVKDMKNDSIFANYVYNQFSKPVEARIQNFISGEEEVKTRISNSDSSIKSKVFYDLMADSNAVGREEFRDEDLKSLSSINTKLENHYVKGALVSSIPDINYNDIKKIIVNYVSKHFPTINIDNFTNWFFDDQNTATIDNLQSLVKGLIEYQNGLSSALDNENKYLVSYNKEYAEYIKYVNSLEEGKANNREVPEYKESEINKKLRNKALITLSNSLLNVVAHNLRLNTSNAEGKMASSVIKNSYITDFFKQLRVKLENGQDGVEVFKEFVTQNKFGISDYEANALLFGIKGRDGKYIRRGIFYKDEQGNYQINPKAQDILDGFGVSLYDGIHKVQTQNGIVYERMSKEDFLLSSIFSFNASVRFDYSNNEISNEKFGNFFMRIPSDASNIYMIQMPKYSSKNLYKYGKGDELNRLIDKHVASLDNYIVEEGALYYDYESFEKRFTDVVGKKISNSWIKELNELVKDYSKNKKNNILKSEDMISLLITGKIRNINTADYTTLKVKGDKNVYIPFVFKSDNEKFVVLTEGQYKKGTTFVEELSIKSIHSLEKVKETKTDYMFDLVRDSSNNEIPKTTEVSKMISSLLYSNNNLVAQVLYDRKEISRDYDKNSDIFLAYRNELWGELQQFAINLNNITEKDENGDWVIREDTNSLFEFFHYNGSIIKDGKLTGNVFKFTKLFSDTYNVNDAVEKLLNIYGSSDSLIIQRADGKYIINRNRLSDIFYVDTVKGEEIITVGTDFQSNLTPELNNGIDTIIENWLDSYITEIGNQKNNFESIINSNYNVHSFEEWALNMPLAYMTFDALFEGSSKYYKDAQTFFKRAKETQMGGSTYSAGTFGEYTTDLYEVLDYSGKVQEVVVNDKNGKNLFNSVPTLSNNNVRENKPLSLRNGFRAVTIHNSRTKYEHAQEIYDTIKKQLLSQGFNEETSSQIAASIALPFGDINGNTGESTKSNDAQSYITIEEFARRKQAEGTIDEYKDLIAQLVDPNVPLSDINLSEVANKIQIQKNVYYDVVYDEETGMHRPRQIKNAEFVLIPKLLDKDSSLYALYQLMRKHDIGQVNTLETSKASNKNVLTFWDNNENVDLDSFESSLTGIKKGEVGVATYPAVELYYYNHLYKQLDVVDHIEDKENKAGIQFLKKIQDNLIDETRPYANNIQEAFSANIKESYNRLIDKLGWKTIVNEDSTLKIVNKDGTENLKYNYFYRECLREFERVGIDSNIEDYLKPGIDGNPLMPEWFPILSTKLENIAQAVFNNNITRQTISGYHGVQTTNIGWSRKLKYYPVEEGKQLPVVEIMIPAYSKPIKDAIKKLGKEKVLELLREKGLDEHIGYRIPTEGKQSMAIFRVVDFLDDAYGSTIVVPNEWVTQTGSDFDVDSIYSLISSLVFDGEKFTKVEYDLEKGLEHSNSRYIEKLKYEANQYELANITKNINNFEKLKEIGKEMGVDYDYFMTLTPMEQLTKDARNNYIIDNVIKILSNPASFEEIFGRSNFDDITNAKKRAEKLSDNNLSKASVYNPFDQLRFMQNAIDGRALKALSVNRDTFVSINNRVQTYLPEQLGIRVVYTYGEQYKKDIIEKSYNEISEINEGKRAIVNHRMFGWSKNNRNVVGRLITSYSSETTAHMLDAIKEGALFNETLYTFGTFKTLIDVGIDYQTAINWLYQPAITRINNINNESNSVYLDVNKDATREAILQLSLELKLTDTNYIKLEDVFANLAKMYSEDFNEILSEVFYTDYTTRNFAINGEALERRLQGLDINGKEVDGEKLDIRNKIFDLLTTIQFQNYKNITDKIENVARVLRPDSFGAKQIIRETKNIVADVEKYTKKNKRGDAYADILSQQVGDEKRNIIDAIYTENNSAYNYLYNFYKYATKASVEINTGLFKTEQDNFQAIIQDIEKKLGKRLSDESYLRAKKYIIASVFKNVPTLYSPVTINEHGFPIIDKEAIKSSDVLAYWETEIGRIYGLTETEVNSPNINFVKPSSEDIATFTKLTPAQKVLFIKSHFTDSNFFDKVSVNKFFRNELTTKGYSYSRIFLNDLSYDIDTVRNEFLDALFNKNPIIKLAAIDILKYAFIVEGYDFRKQNVSKAIPNQAIYARIEDGGLNILNQSVEGFNTLQIAPYLNLSTSDNFIRANSDLIKAVYIKKNKPVKGTMQIADDGVAETKLKDIADLLDDCIKTERLIIIPKTNEYKPLLDKLNLTDRESNFIRITYKAKNNKYYKTDLFKIINNTASNKIYLIPINLLENFENSYLSVNNKNNEHRDYQFYLNLIREDIVKELGIYEDTINQLEQLGYFKDVDKETDKKDILYNYLFNEHNIDSIKEKIIEEKGNSENVNDYIDYLTSLGDQLNSIITRTQNELISELPKYKFGRVVDEQKLINLAIVGDAAQKAQLNKFFTDITDTLKEVPAEVKSNIIKNSSPVIQKTLGLWSTKQTAIYYVPNEFGDNPFKIRIQRYNTEKLIKKQEGTLRKSDVDTDYYAERFGKLNKTDVLYKFDIVSEENIDEHIVNTDTRDSRYDGDDLFTETEVVVEDNLRRNIADLIVKDIKFQVRQQDKNASNILHELQEAGIKLDNRDSLDKNYVTIYGVANKYYKREYDSIISQINDFTLENGESYSIADSKLYQEASPVDFQNLLTLLLRANHFIGVLDDLSIYNFVGEDEATNKEILKLKEYSNALKNNPNVKIAFSKVFNRYLVGNYSTNPLLKTSFTDVNGNKHYLFNATDAFGDISVSASLISDIGHIPNKQIQLVVKAINEEIYAAEYSGRQKVLDFERFIKNEIGDNSNEIFRKLIDKNGKIIQPYTDEYIEDYYKFKDELVDLEVSKGRYSKEYFEKKLAFDKWQLKNRERRIVDSYYKECVDLDEYTYNIAGEAFLRYKQINYLLNYNYHDSYALTEAQVEEKKRLLEEKKELLNYYTPDGDFKSEEELKKIKALEDYSGQLMDIKQRYFESKEFDEFKQNLKHNLDVIKKIDAEHPHWSLTSKLEIPEYNIAYNWVKSNTTRSLNPEAQKALVDAYKDLGIESRTRKLPEVQKIYDDKKANDELYDASGTVIGTNFTTDEIKDILDAEAQRYAYRDKPLWNDVLVEQGLYKNVPETPMLSKKFWDIYYNPDARNESAIRRKQQLYYEINTTIRKGINKDTGLLVARQLFDNCTEEELQQLAENYKELAGIKTKGLSKKALKLFVEKVNQDAFDEQYGLYAKLGTKKEKELFELIFCETDENGEVVIDDSGRFKPNPYIYGYMELTPKVLKEHPEYIDEKKTNALKLIQDNLEFVPTIYYEQALHNNIKEAEDIYTKKYKEIYDSLISSGKEDKAARVEARKQAELARDKHKDDWFNNNHYWNKYTGKYEPISIWTQRRIKENGTLPSDIEYNATFENMESVPKETSLNKKYSDFGANYKSTGDYTNTEYASILSDENSKEYKLYRKIEEIMNSAKVNSSARRFIEQGFAPRKYKVKTDAQWVLKQGLGALGVNFADYKNKSWTDDVSYYTDHSVINPMLQPLKFKGYEQQIKAPAQEFGQSDEDYNRVLAEIRQQNNDIRKRNLENEKAYRDEDWYNVFRQFIYNQEQVNVRENVKKLAYLTVDDIRQRDVYKVNAFGKVSTSRYSKDSSPDYITTNQKRTEDIFVNWLRRIIYSEYKELSPYNKYADILQNMSSAKYMMFNIYAAINNVTVGGVNILGEIFAKEYFDTKSWIDATKEYDKSIFNIIKDTFSETSHDRTTAILKLFNAVEIDRTIDFTGGDIELSKFAEHFNTIAYSLQSSGEHAMQNKALIAMLKTHRVVVDPQTGKKTIMSFGEYSSGLELAALSQVISNDEYLLEKLNQMITTANQDKQLAYEYDKLKRNIITDFFLSLPKSDKKTQIYNEFVARRKEMMKNDKEEFEKYKDVWSQLEVNEDGVAQFTAESELDESAFGVLKNKAIYVNKKIHGVYDKNGAAQIEKKWYGSLVMQFKKHIYPGIMKRWRTRGYYNETRGTFEKGSYISLFDFLAMEFKTYSDKKNARLGRKEGQVVDPQEQDYQTNAALASIQTIFECIFDTVHNFKYNYNILPTWEQNNIRRALADLCGVMAALLTVFIIYALTDEDDLEDSTLLNSALYLADRLYGESRMYMPQGIIPEIRTQWSQPIAGAGVVKDLYTAMGMVNSFLFDENFDPVYGGNSPYKGQNKVAVVVKRNIPIVRTVQRISTINSSNKYYRIGDNGVSEKLVKNIAIKIRKS